jgi:two-component system, sensor histidine kinase and response regulator
MTPADAPPASDLNESELPSPNPSFRNAKVLVIDDTAEIRMIISESLKIYGFTTLVADDGIAGIEMARQHCPDLIICDINMPNLDGYATLTAIRQNESTSTTPFIFLSGAAEKPNVRRGMELGADDYLTKPFTHKELVTAVNARLVKKAELQRQSDKKLDELRGNITLALPHELRTPLHGIMGLASLMIADYATMTPDEVLENSRFIHEAAARLHRLIENFLVYSQIELLASEAKRIEVPASVPPVKVHETIPAVARALAERHKRTADLKLELEPAELRVPEDNFKKIIEELVDNAFKFSEPGQQVCISSEVARHGVSLTITDHGRGMTAEQIAKIAPHIQFDRRTYEQQGAGLGLIIAKRLTELLGGTMSVESKPSVQTAVKISFSLV